MVLCSSCGENAPMPTHDLCAGCDTDALVEPLFRTEHRGMGSYRYRSDDNGQTWQFLGFTHEEQSARDSLERAEMARIQREYK